MPAERDPLEAEAAIQLVGLAYDPIFTWDLETRAVLYWNHGAESLYGWRSEEVLGRDPSDVIHTEFSEPLERIRRCLTAEGHWEGQALHRRRDGRQVAVDMRLTLVAAPGGGRARVLEVNRDVTARLEAEQLRTRYLNRVTHELMTPLAAIVGFADLLTGAELPEEPAAMVRAIATAADRLQGLIEGVLDLNVLSSADPPLDLAATRVADIVEEALHAADPTGDRMAGWRLDLDSAKTTPVRVDRRRAAQALSALLTNAALHGGDPVEVVARVEDGRVAIAVRDSGPGMSPQQVAVVGQPFERVGAERTTVAGAGLGVAIARRIAHAMGGDVDITSALGRGTTATLWLPVSSGDGADDGGARAQQ